MIKKIDIAEFGLFKNYSWNASIGNAESFRRLNIIYGRNYSGKTTLSRIFKSLEDGSLHKNYDSGSFTITFADGKIVTDQQLATNFKIRVYNSDFVRENLSWLYNDDGSIKPFTILGAKNIELDKKINDILIKLGSIDGKGGLHFSLAEKVADQDRKQSSYNSKFNDLEDKLRKRANDKIKIDRNLFLPTPSKKGYSISDIKGDIAVLGKDANKFILTSETTEERKRLLKEAPLPNIGALNEATPNFSKYYDTASELVGRKIRPSAPIADLVNDSLLQEWVRQGIDKHKGKRKTCGFCGNVLGEDLWGRLDAHFSKESEDLRAEIKKHVNDLVRAKQGLSGFLKLTKDQFYSSLSATFDLSLAEWLKGVMAYESSIDKIIAELTEREKDVFKDRKISDIPDASDSILAAIKAFNKLIGEHNRKTKTLDDDQAKARSELLKSDIAQFLRDIDYKTAVIEIERLRAESEHAQKEVNVLTEQIAALEEEQRTFEAEAKDESKGAELVNHRLSHFFGHNELRLVADGEGASIKFKIQREGVDANNLSEGECSLISFCYFVARIEDELRDESNSKQLIVYIDDPISSLDSNHVFFMFSLIESVIAGPKKYAQLFISTHNLDFLKYLRRLTIPKWKPQPSSGQQADLRYFIIDRRNKASTQLKIAPDYLKNYITEFNFLFKQIHECSTADAATLSHEYQYNFGNNMRKFLEAYLFYKYPSHKMEKDERLKKFLDGDSVSVNLVNRVINEYSHIGEQFDRGMEPVDIDEIKKIAVLIVDKIKQSDPDQYIALVDSIS